jgi:predicted esterase
MLLAMAFLAALGAGRVSAAEVSAEEIVAIVDGSEDLDSTVEKLKSLSVSPGTLAAVLRSWTPRTRPFEEQLKTVALKGGDGRRTDLLVYVPKAYDGKKAWPCMIALHGLGGKGRQMIDVLRPVADRYGYLLAAPSAKSFKGMLPMLRHWWKYGLDGFPLAALAWMKRRFNVDDDRVLLTGYSMGGFGTWNVGLGFPDRFCALGAFAGGISRMEYMLKRDGARRKLLANAALLPVTFAHGDRDRVVPVRFDRQTREDLEKAGIPHTYHEIAGGSHLLTEILAVKDGDFEKGWIVTKLFERLKKTVRSGLDAPFSFTSLSAPARARWVSIDETNGTPASVTLSIEDKTVHVKTTNVKKLTLFFDGRVLPFDKLAAVTLNREKIPVERLTPNLRTVVGSWRELRDRCRVFVATLTLDDIQ